MKLLCALGVALVCSACAGGYEGAYGLAGLQGRPMPQPVQRYPTAAGTRYNVIVTRLAADVYQDFHSQRVIQTSLCLEMAIQEPGILKWDSIALDNWIYFATSRRSCDVKALR